MSPLTAHVLDTSLGRPAPDLLVRLAQQRADGTWQELAERVTNADGRVLDLLPEGALEACTYRLTFETGAYFAASNRRCFYPRVEVLFQVDAPHEHHHVPLLLSPFGYSTYRGS